MQRKMRNLKSKKYRGKVKKNKAALKKESDDLRTWVAGEKREAMRIHHHNRENIGNVVRVGTCPTRVSMFLPSHIPTLWAL